MRNSKLRILIVAEHASARFGGEAFLPLHYFRILRSRGIEAWLVCHTRVKDEICALFPKEKDRLFFIPDTKVHKLLWEMSKPLPPRIISVTLGAASHLITQLMQRRLVRKLVGVKRVDIVHEPIPVSPKQPSAMYDVGAPVVIGPMNGGMNYPEGFSYLQRPFERFLINLSRASANVFNLLIPGKRKAAVLLVANQRTSEALPAVVNRVRTLELVENGVDLSRWNAPTTEDRIKKSRVLFSFVGRLLELKGVDILLEAFQKVTKECDAHLDIFGDGDCRDGLTELANRLGLNGQVSFHGFVSQDKVANELAKRDVLILPSLHECGGAVVLEAMALGLPVIATNWGGPADYIDESCGILIDPTSRSSFISGLGKAMIALAESKGQRRRLGRYGRQKVIEEYDWERKVDRILEIYEEAACYESSEEGSCT